LAAALAYPVHRFASALVEIHLLWPHQRLTTRAAIGC